MSNLESRLTRRAMLARLAAIGLSFTGEKAFAQRLALAPVARWNERFEVAIEVAIAQPGGSRSKRPYVAVWLEDSAGKSVRTVGVWVQRSGRGPRWIADLRRWFRADRQRQAEGGADLLGTVSGATRIPGTYTLIWNGRNDAGTAVDQGQYFVCVEAAREHGSYQLIRQDFTFGARAFEATLPGNPEISAVTIRYRERKQT